MDNGEYNMSKFYFIRFLALAVLIVFVITTPFFGQTNTQGAIQASYYVQDLPEGYSVSDIHTPAIAISTDNTFIMRVNLLAGMGRITGTYKKTETTFENFYRFTILNTNFKGFSFDNLRQFTVYTINNEYLLYSGPSIGVTGEGAIFRRSSTMPSGFN